MKRFLFGVEMRQDFLVCAGEPTLAAGVDWSENAGNRQAHRPRHRQNSMGF